jgi:hypothetical protein
MITLLKIVFCLFLISCLPNFAESCKESLLRKYQIGIPEWMINQASLDLAAFSNQYISLNDLDYYYETSSPDLYLIKFTIKNNQITAEWKEKNISGVDYRRKAYEDALRTISEVLRLSDTTFLISMHDAYAPVQGIPIFCMCKRQKDNGLIALPDFDALYQQYQVLSKHDLTQYEPSWSEKKSQLSWRGSTAQASLDEELMRPDNAHRFSRVILCKLSDQFPDLIDAKFTFFAQGGENVPSLQSYKGKKLSYRKLIDYKYQLLIDGNVCPYSNSGWKFFINSLLFKPDSQWIQWYFSALVPYEHYIPVERDLSDLVEKIQWAKHNDDKARTIAKNCRNFALSHLTLSDDLLYMYYVLTQYSKLVVR